MTPPNVQPADDLSTPLDESKTERKILTVSQLTGGIKALLEGKIGAVWLRGEISNIRVPSSGHAYFTLKDESAQISAVMFRGRMQGMKFELADGMEVIGFGKISVYEPRGNYQIVLEKVEPAGLGLLQAAFEKLKEKLAKEGLFDVARKRPLPFLPERVGLVTSTTGAAIRDMLKVLGRRNPKVSILIAPAKVQGEGAAAEIALAIADLNRYSEEVQKLDVLIVGRGGGSLEDLWAFNEEVVARAIAASTIPVISAVGHEIDFTISDFVADVRAPTPSAAAEIVAPVYSELLQMLLELRTSLNRAVLQGLKDWRQKIGAFTDRLQRPDRRLADLHLRLNDWSERLQQVMQTRLQRQRQSCLKASELLLRASPLVRAAHMRLTLAHVGERLARATERYVTAVRRRLEVAAEALGNLSPLQILARGYAVARDAVSHHVLRDAAAVTPGQVVEIILHQGTVQAKVVHATEPDSRQRPKKKTGRDSSEDPQRPLW